MSKVQDTIHRFVVDATIVAGCVCMVLTTKSVIGSMNNLNNTIGQLNATISETRTLIAQRDGDGALVGGLAYEANQLMRRSGELIGAVENILAQFGGRGVSADGAVGQFTQTIAHINQILLQMRGTGADPGLVAQLRVTVDRLNNLVDQGSGLVEQVKAKGGILDKAGHAIDGVNGLVDQVGNRTIVLTDSDKRTMSDRIGRMLGCYSGYKNIDGTKDSIDKELFGDKTADEIAFMVASFKMMSQKNDFHVAPDVWCRVQAAGDSVDRWISDNQGKECSAENMKSFCECFRELSRSLDVFFRRVAITEVGQKPGTSMAIDAIGRIADRLNRESLFNVLLRAPVVPIERNSAEARRFMQEVCAGV